MNTRLKKKNTSLFFDSFKHFKNNFSNLICLELPTLIAVGTERYLSTKPVNYKSKFPDMKKIGLIDYDKPSSFDFKLSDEGEEIYSIIDKYHKDFSYNLSLNARLVSITPSILWDKINESDKKIITGDLVKLLISYYDTADCIRPYLTLIKIIEEHNITKIDNDTLCVIFAQSKANILVKKVDENAFDQLDNETRMELKRPISYVLNGLETAGIIDHHGSVIYDKERIKDIVMSLNEIYYQTEDDFESPRYSGRSAKDQKRFHDEVLNAYGYKCAITGESIEIKNINNSISYLIEAAHIIPYSDSGSFSVNNGIALSIQMHKMFDKKLFAFEYNDNGDLEIVVAESNKIIDKTGLLASLNHKTINLPSDKKNYPDIDAIEYRKENYLLT